MGTMEAKIMGESDRGDVHSDVISIMRQLSP